MSSRLKIFGLIAILGFVAGIIAQVFATQVIPWIQLNWPDLGQFVPYLVAGVVGAVLTVALVSAWAYMTGKKDPY
jgi:uncharacterized membrane protein YeaQ/YmgE (transglycosylase-associated protein family)